MQNCSKISEKVQKALELFEQIKRLHTQAEVDRKNCALATENTKKVRKQQEALEEQETQWKKQSEELAEVDKKLVRQQRIKRQESRCGFKGDRGCSELEKSGRAVPQKSN
mgnify:CR=1 FL=1